MDSTCAIAAVDGPFVYTPSTILHYEDLVDLASSIQILFLLFFTTRPVSLHGEETSLRGSDAGHRAACAQPTAVHVSDAGVRNPRGRRRHEARRSQRRRKQDPGAWAARLWGTQRRRVQKVESD